MGRLEFACDCGQTEFLNNTDNRSFVAHLIADKDYVAFADVLVAAIEPAVAIAGGHRAAGGPTPTPKFDWREFPMPLAWQCRVCGSLYVETPDRQRHRFLPAADDVPKQLFRPKPEAEC